MSAPRITSYPDAEGRPGFLLKVPGPEEFTQALKTVVPPEDLYWEAATGSWWVPDAYLDSVTVLVLGEFGDVVLHPADRGRHVVREEGIHP